MSLEGIAVILSRSLPVAWQQREVRDHFNCPTMRGAELENQGGHGVALYHWEKRIFGVRLRDYPSLLPPLSLTHTHTHTLSLSLSEI